MRIYSRSRVYIRGVCDLSRFLLETALLHLNSFTTSSCFLSRVIVSPVMISPSNCGMAFPFALCSRSNFNTESCPFNADNQSESISFAIGAFTVADQSLPKKLDVKKSARIGNCQHLRSINENISQISFPDSINWVVVNASDILDCSKPRGNQSLTFPRVFTTCNKIWSLLP